MRKQTSRQADMRALAQRLAPIHVSAANSLNEDLEELLTLHRLGMYDLFGQSFRTTNCIENLNSQLGKYLRNVKYWNNSMQRHRWVAAALLEIEQSMHKVANYRTQNQLQNAIILDIAPESSPGISTKIGT